MAALTRCYSLPQNVNKVADFTFYRLQNIPKTQGQCQSSKHFVTLSRVKPKKYQLFFRAPVRNFRSKQPTIISESRKPGLLSQILKPLGFTVLVGSTSFASLLFILHEKTRNPEYYFKTHREEYLQFLRVVIGIIGMNCAVLILWRVPQLHSFMSKYFTCANGQPVISMLLSSFSHSNGIHLLMNMYVFWTFSGPLFNTVRQTEVFSWLYINGAIVSSLTSLMLKAVRFSAIPSVGASGAILTCIACVCYAFPKATLGFPIISDLTGFYFTAETGLKGIILLDVCGIIFRWNMLDHAGHLGGVLFGLWYMHYGRHQINKLVQKYHRLQSGGKKK
ncbi:hypothetical protein LOTGIDRAFT_160105 [Lottia gigantea]|uniref:rhomboid protease n=1 Tax=Lottia gigantea TaxID=225164 RepID=V3ZX63_LOTGI|nr:hypothetical protein LOTGIDRAFT_160105 [Lottia gigantea]ESO96118.1 hypothetical protein LOTGIDRAFT_160105 [Lottia gigantea]